MNQSTILRPRGVSHHVAGRKLGANRAAGQSIDVGGSKPLCVCYVDMSRTKPGKGTAPWYAKDFFHHAHKLGVRVRVVQLFGDGDMEAAREDPRTLIGSDCVAAFEAVGSPRALHELTARDCVLEQHDALDVAPPRSAAPSIHAPRPVKPVPVWKQRLASTASYAADDVGTNKEILGSRAAVRRAQNAL